MARFGRTYIKPIILKTKIGRDYHVTTSDAITPVETIHKTISRKISDSVSLTETVKAIKLFFVNLTDHLSLIETIKRASTKAIRDTVTLLETVKTTRGLFMRISDSIIFSETVTKLVLKLILIKENITLYEKVRGWLNNIMVFPWRDKYTSQGTTYSDKYQKQNTQWEDKYH